MGIVGLWETLEPAAERVSFSAYTVGEAARWKNLEHRGLILGVDMSAVMCECTAATLAAGVHGQFQGGALRIFFNKLCNFRKGAATLIFVSDGCGRPEIKRGAKVVNREVWWTAQAIELIGNFGFYHYQAPGEAEAELAQLNRRGLIDGVVTSDSDTIVFSAPVVLRSIPKTSRQTYNDEMALYTLDSIQQVLSLTSGGLLLFALLSGGDYTQGVYGCGRAVALGLARCGFGDQLLEAIQKDEDPAIFSPRLRGLICAELRDNPQGELGTRHPRLAAGFPDNFPNPEIVHLYNKPLTSWSCSRAIPSRSTWTTREPSISKIAQFCYDNLGWKTESILKEKLHGHLWEGVFAQMLFSPLLLYNPTTKVLATPNVQAQVLSAKKKRRKGQFSGLVPQPRLSISVKNFVSLMGRGYSTENLKALVVWASDDFLPGGVVQADISSGKRKQRTITTSSQDTANNTDTMDSRGLMPIVDTSFAKTGLKRKSWTRKAPPAATPPSFDWRAGPLNGNPRLPTVIDLTMEPGPSFSKQHPFVYDGPVKVPSVNGKRFLGTIDLTNSSPDVHEQISLGDVDLTELRDEEEVSLTSSRPAEKGEPVQKTGCQYLGFIDL